MVKKPRWSRVAVKLELVWGDKACIPVDREAAHVEWGTIGLEAV